MEAFDYRTRVTLTATEGTGHTFVSWDGAFQCDLKPTCVVDVRGDTTVTASFEPIPYYFNVVIDGNGSVKSLPLGIDCGGDCVQLFDYGTSVTLTATPDPGHKLSEWINAPSCGVNEICKADVQGDTTVTAVFEPLPYDLTVSVVGDGFVTSTPAGIFCGVDCTEAIPVRHERDAGRLSLHLTTWRCSGWSAPGCEDNGPCTITVTEDTTVEAEFGCPMGSQTFTYTGAEQTLTLPGCITEIDVDARGRSRGCRVLDRHREHVWALGASVVAWRLRWRSLRARPFRCSWARRERDAGNGVVGPGGYNGGGDGGANVTQFGGGGGGASDVRIGGSALADRVVVASGGGGAAACATTPYDGGDGGGLVGLAPLFACGGTLTVATGGTQAAGGFGAATTRDGVSAASVHSPWGAMPASPARAEGVGLATTVGAAGPGRVGGGGSSFAESAATNVVHTTGFQAGDGEVTISW